MLLTKAYAVHVAKLPAVPFQIERREPGPHDVLFDILYCGICHTDVHITRGEFPNANFPMVPGHEIVGRVVKVGSAVVRHKVGDTVGVGCMVDSCGTCPECGVGEEQFCAQGFVSTYNSLEKDGKTPTYGGYSERMTVNENFVLKISPTLSPAAAAPLLCAGITTWSPLRHWKVGKGSKVGVIGLGGLGHIAVKLAVAMGAEVTVLSTSDSKQADATRLGAIDFANTRNEDTFTRLSERFDLILNTVSAAIHCDAFVSLLRRDGTLVLLGVSDAPATVNTFGLMWRRRNISSSVIGGIRETQEMLDFCAQHNVVSDIEIIPMDRVNEAYERMRSGDVRYRFVIDMATLR
jgi:alcohol dehydrogenase (NADP+)